MKTLKEKYNQELAGRYFILNENYRDIFNARYQFIYTDSEFAIITWVDMYDFRIRQSTNEYSFSQVFLYIKKGEWKIIKNRQIILEKIITRF